MATLLFTSLIPLILFAIFNYYCNLRQGVIASVLTAFALAAFSKYYLDYFDIELIIMIVLLLAMGGWSIHTKNEVFFKLQPAITSVVSVLILAYYQFFDTPFVLKMIPKVAAKMPEAHLEVLTSEHGQALLTRVSIYSMIWILVHAALLAWAARYRSTASWLTIKALFLPFFFVTVIATEFAYLKLIS